MEAHRVFRYLGDEMQRRGHVVHYFFERNPVQRHASLSTLGQSIRISPFLSTMCRRKGYDVLIYPGALGWCLSTFRRWMLPSATKIISWHTNHDALHSPPSSTENSGASSHVQKLIHGLHQWSSRQALKTQDGCLLSSTIEAEQLKQHFPAESHKIAYLPTGVSSQFYYPERYLHIDSIAPYRLLWVGHWHLQQNTISHLAAAWKELRNKHPQLHLSLLNTQQPGASILQHFPEDTHPAITVVPTVDENELIEAYRSHQLFLMPAKTQITPLSLLEAMANALPVVASQGNATSHLITHYENGMLIPPEDNNALVQTVSHLVENPSLCRQLGESAYDTVSRYYTWQQIGDIFEGHLNRVLQAGTTETKSKTTEASSTSDDNPPLS